MKCTYSLHNLAVAGACVTQEWCGLTRCHHLCRSVFEFIEPYPLPSYHTRILEPYNHYEVGFSMEGMPSVRTMHEAQVPRQTCPVSAWYC